MGIISDSVADGSLLFFWLAHRLEISLCVYAYLWLTKTQQSFLCRFSALFLQNSLYYLLYLGNCRICRFVPIPKALFLTQAIQQALAWSPLMVSWLTPSFYATPYNLLLYRCQWTLCSEVPLLKSHLIIYLIWLSAVLHEGVIVIMIKPSEEKNEYNWGVGSLPSWFFPLKDDFFFLLLKLGKPQASSPESSGQ